VSADLAATKGGTGYRAAAVLIAIVSVLSVLGGLREPLSLLGVALTPLERADLLVPAIVGFVTAWALWVRDRRAPECFLAWAVAVMLATWHMSVTLVPRVLVALAAILPELGLPPGMSTGEVVVNLLINGALLSIGYWQIAKQRPGAAR